MAGHAREDFADLHAWHVRGNWPIGATNFRRGVGLGVPGIELAGAADQKEHDAVDVAVGFGGGSLVSK